MEAGVAECWKEPAPARLLQPQLAARAVNKDRGQMSAVIDSTCGIIDKQ